MPTTTRADNLNVLLDGKNVTYSSQQTNEYSPAIIGNCSPQQKSIIEKPYKQIN